MILRVERRFKGETYTIGTMYVNGERFCDTLEDKVRDLAGGEAKVPGETAIPEGTYRVIVNRSPKFGRDLPRLLDVPQFEGVLIHRGNSAEDSAGCILVGENKEKGKVINSTPYEERLVALCKAAQSRGETIEIEVV
jgi:hypothetical protein